jgi:hypothetical protein
MKYTLVNKNKLIPSIIIFTSEKSAIRELIEITNNYNNQTLFKNVYIYASDYNEETEYIIFNQNNNIVKKKLSNNDDYLTFFNIDNLYNKINLIINPKYNNKNIVINEHNQINEDDKHNQKDKDDKDDLNTEKDKIKKSCEEIFAIYNTELSKIKKIENNIKNLEKKEDKLNNKIMNQSIDSVNKLYLDYKTFLKIKEKFNNNSEKFSIPELFIKKYMYFNELLLNSDYNTVFDKLKTLNINEPNDYLLNKDIIIFSKKYMLDSKTLNCSFDHDWDDLTSDTEGIVKPKGWSSRT